MAVETSDEPLDVIWVFRPLGMETWFLLEQRNCCSPKNKHVDGIRCDIVYAYPAIDGVVRWKIDGRFVTPKQLVKLETARTQEEKIRIAGVLIDTAEVKSRGHTVVRELLSVYDQPRLQVRKCLTNSDETVKLVAIGLRQPPPIESEAEVIIHPIADHEFRLKRSRSPPEVFIKAEVTEPNENQDPRTDQKADQTPNQEMPGNSTPPRKKRRNKLQAGEESPKRKIYSLRRRKPS